MHTPADTSGVNGSPLFARAMLAVTLVLALTVPIVLLLLWDRDGSSGAADESLPISTFSDDKFRSASNDPATAPPDSKSPTPSESRTPSETPSATPSDTPEPTGEPVPASSDTFAPTRVPTRATTGPAQEPTHSPSTTAPTSRPTTTAPPPPPSQPPPPSNDGSMTDQERELFTLIDDARADYGCGRLKPKTSLTRSARTHADEQAESNTNDTGDGTDAIAEAGSPRDAFNQMMDDYAGVLLDCGRDRLGIGYADAPGGPLCDLGICTDTERRWAADFD